MSSEAKSTTSGTVPFLNLKKLYLDHKDEFMQAIGGVLEKAAFIGGEQVTTFEQRFAAWIGPGNYCVGSANGTDAITIGARALGLPPGSEAIVPAMTYIATAAGLMQAGFKVKLVDVTEGDWLMDVSALEKAITPKTKLIAPVHLYGQMAAMDKIREIANKHNLLVLEDAAQAHGAQWQGKPVGTWGDVATFSFYPGKNLGAFGDAGAIVSRKPETIEAARALGNQGGIKKYEHYVLGYNSRLDNLQAAALNVKLKYIDGWNEARRNVAHMYREMLTGIPELKLPVENPAAKHVYHLYVVQVEDRDAFMAFMKERGVETGIHYPKAIHQLPAFANEPFATQKFANAERLAKHGVSLPMCPTLSLEHVRRVADSVKAYFGKSAT